MVIAACSQTPDATAVDPATAAKAREAGAAKELASYEQMRTGGSPDVAASVGEEILKKYPGTAAADQVQKTIGELKEKAAQQAETRRLARLWSYASAAQTGGTQYTAAIESRTSPAPTTRVRLVLRQHPQWGQSVYLLLDKTSAFDCGKGCATLAVAFDGAPAQRMKSLVPPTGEPALFIEDDKGFIARMQKAQTVAIDVSIKGVGAKTLLFEVGGYDAARMPERHKQ
jgi:hypothetical protein